MASRGATKLIRDPEFGKRLTQTCDANPDVPPVNYGRLTWLRDNFAKRFDDEVSIETVRKWFSGEVKPRIERIRMLAKMLEVDEAWLTLGVQPEMSQKDRKIMNAEADGAVIAVAGLIKMAGGFPAFPEEGDSRAKRDSINLYAIIRGAQYGFHIMAAQPQPKGVKFAVPTQHEATFQMGVIPLSDFQLQLIEIPTELIAKGNKRGPTIDVTMTAADIRKHEIKSLRNRL